MANKTAVQDRSGTTLSKLRAYLRLNSSDYDDILTDILAAAKEKADLYCNNNFLAADGVTEQNIPPTVELWIKMFCAKVFSHPKLQITSSQVVNIGTEIISEVYDSMYLDLKQHRRLPGLSSR